MTLWSDGYVSEVNYTSGFYREISPLYMHFCAVSHGYQAPNISMPFSYCELGFGMGTSIAMLASAFPHGDFYGTDFNPRQMLAAEKLVEEAGLKNCHLYADSFQDFRKQTLPQFDFIALHGIYSWINQENRRAILDFIRQKLKPGGLVYISYNSLPGWSKIMPVRDLMIQHTEQTTGPLVERIQKAIHFVEDIIEDEPDFFVDADSTLQWFSAIRSGNPSYLAHEFFNQDLTPFYFRDIASDMESARLSYFGSLNPIRQIEALSLPEKARSRLKDTQDIPFKETVLDYYLDTKIRKDLFGLGAFPITMVEQQDILDTYSLMLVKPLTDIRLNITTPAGTVNLNSNIYTPLLEALVDKPLTIGALRADPNLAHIDQQALFEAVRILLSERYVDLCPDAPTRMLADRYSHSINHAVVSLHMKGYTHYSHLISPVTGSPLTLTGINVILVAAELDHVPDRPQFVGDHLKRLGHTIIGPDGLALEDSAKIHAVISKDIDHFDTMLKPLLKRLQILPV